MSTVFILLDKSSHETVSQKHKSRLFVSRVSFRRGGSSECSDLAVNVRADLARALDWIQGERVKQEVVETHTVVRGTGLQDQKQEHFDTRIVVSKDPNGHCLCKHGKSDKVSKQFVLLLTRTLVDKLKLQEGFIVEQQIDKKNKLLILNIVKPTWSWGV